MVVMNEIIFHIRWSHISKWGWKCVFVLGCHNLWNYVRFRINIIPHPSCHGQRGWGEGRGCHSVAGELIAIQYEKFNTLMLHRWWRLRIAMTINNIARSVATVQLQLTRTGRKYERVHEHGLQRGCWSINGHWTSSSFLISLCWGGTCSSSNNNS